MRSVVEWNVSQMKCPECGSRLLTGDGFVWCSNMGSRFRDSCPFGVNIQVRMSEFLKDREKTGGE